MVGLPRLKFPKLFVVCRCLVVAAEEWISLPAQEFFWFLESPESNPLSQIARFGGIGHAWFCFFEIAMGYSDSAAAPAAAAAAALVVSLFRLLFVCSLLSSSLSLSLSLS